MTYKLLCTNGAMFVCLENGIKIPLQTSSVITQVQREKARVALEAYLDDRIGTPSDVKLTFENNQVKFGDYVLDNIEDAQLIVGDAQNMTIIRFSVTCSIVDTIEAPKKYFEK